MNRDFFFAKKMRRGRIVSFFLRFVASRAGLIFLPLLLASFFDSALLHAQTRGSSYGSSTSEEIKPPFGLEWGESSDRLEKLLNGAKAQIVEKRDIAGREAWTVEGLVQPGLRRTMFYFHDGQLIEVELQYQSPEWDSTKYDDFMSQVRRRIEQKFGAGQLIARSRAPEGDVLQTIVGYKWNLNNTAIQLFYYAAERASDTYRTVSVHYKAL